MENRYKTSEFEARVRNAERTARCQNSAVEMGENLVALTVVAQALKEGKVLPGRYIEPLSR